MKLGVHFGFFTGRPPAHVPAMLVEADRLGYDIALTGETWGTDAFTPLAWWGSQTATIRLGTAVVQLAARTPTATAMAALTLDQFTDGRFVLGLGVSGPQVVEGWYGQPFAKPIGRTREYVRIVRKVFARDEPVTSDGPYFPMPYRGEGSLGLGKALKVITHPYRNDIPIILGAEGPRNVALTAEIADGWQPIFCGPRTAPTWRPWLQEGWARPGARRGPSDFEIIGGTITITDDIAAAIDRHRPQIGFYIGGMGAQSMNFHKQAWARQGYEREVEQIQRLFLEGKREQAIAAVPDQMVLDAHLIGSPARVRDGLAEWAEAGFTTMLVWAEGVDDIRRAAEVVLGA